MSILFLEIIISCAIILLLLSPIFVIMFDFNNKISKFYEQRRLSKGVEKLVNLMVISNNRKEIESFIKTNVLYLSEKSVNKLTKRIEELEYDRIIGAHSKTRIVEFDDFVESENVKPKLNSNK